MFEAQSRSPYERSASSNMMVIDMARSHVSGLVSCFGKSSKDGADVRNEFFEVKIATYVRKC